MAIRTALFFSDVHLGWVPCRALHRRWLAHLPRAADDAELIVLNGDIIDHQRGVWHPAEEELVQGLRGQVEAWRAEGRRVVYVAGNHDLEGQSTGVLTPSTWRLDIEGWWGERIRVLHGHRFVSPAARPDAHPGLVARAMGAENRLYAALPPMQRIYRPVLSWGVGAIGWTETLHWWRRVAPRVTPHLQGVDVVVHGHLHFGPGMARLGGGRAWRSGAWVGTGQRGAANRMLRYREGRFERITLERGRWVCPDDGR